MLLAIDDLWEKRIFYDSPLELLFNWSPHLSS